MSPPRPQQTLARPVAVRGRGYWSGREVRVEFRPAPLGAGVTFVRDDLPSPVRIPVALASRIEAQRRTVLGTADGAQVEMVEHVLAALAGLRVDNCDVAVSAPEMPGLDGSAAAFVEAIDSVGLRAQPGVVEPLVVSAPVRCGAGGNDASGQWIEARPPIGAGLSIEYRLDYGPGSPVPRQWLMVEVTPASFRDDLSPARTFLLESEAEALRAQGLGAHVGARDLVVYGPNGPIDNELRYPDECVRHKVLDVVGDLALAGRPLVGHVVAHRSGHQLNAQLVQTLLAQSAATRRSA